ncbi:uncharacterized protein LOC143606682 [Bidens hawaiensis]|uniref:uncharacterized protein LOC143606682 n=1 Tax=Bidens hawaiensis TaxID=980011 RepID=UPI0040497CE3
MTKVKKVAQRSGSRLKSPLSLKPVSKIAKDSRHKKQKNTTERKEWQATKCSVCLEYPHKAVLLLCSSHHKGCRSYMCATSNRYSNCLDQYKKAYTKSKTLDESTVDLCLSVGSDELLCPLCRGQVKGWTVVKPARKYFNSKKRNCMTDECSFVGSYKELKKHVRASHPLARPREVDPTLEKKWKKLQNDSELNDVMSTISSTMPGSVIMGDYVIEGGNFRGMNYFDDFIMHFASRTRTGAMESDFDSSDYESEEESEDEIQEIVRRRFAPQVARRRNVVLHGGGSRRTPRA